MFGAIMQTSRLAYKLWVKLVEIKACYCIIVIIIFEGNIIQLVAC